MIKITIILCIWNKKQEQKMKGFIMKMIRSITTLIAILAISVSGFAQWAEDFSGSFGMGTNIDDFDLTNESPQTTDVTSPNRRLDNGLDSGTWGGYAVAGSEVMFMGSPMNDGVVSFVTGSDSSFEKPTGADNGYMLFMLASEGGDETGSYTYTYFPSSRVDLSGDNVRIEWDSCDKHGDNTSVAVRLMVRYSGGNWILSSSIPFIIGASWSGAAIASVQPNSLTWEMIDSPSNSILDALTGTDEEPLVTGMTLPGTMANAFLADVDGFGFCLDVNLIGTLGMPPTGLYIDGLVFQNAVTEVENWEMH
jgi:hypothetical protein